MVKNRQEQTTRPSWRQWVLQMLFCNAMILGLHFTSRQFSVKMLFCVVMFTAFGAGLANAQTYQKTIGNFDNFFVNPQEVAVHPTTGDVYIAASSEIHVLDNEGNFKFKFGGYGQGNGQFSSIGAMDFDALGNLYVGTGHNTSGLPAIQIFDADGNFLSTFGIIGTGANQIGGVRDLALGSDGNIYVLEHTKVKIFDTNAMRLLTIADGQVTWGRQLALDSDDNIYVTDLIKEGVIVYSNTGLVIRSFGSRGTGDGQFQSIAGITIDNNNNIFVSEIGNQRIQVFSIEGTFLRKFASGGLAVSSIANVYAIATDVNNNVYTASASNHKIQKFANDGSFERAFGTGGSLPGQLLNAKDIKIAHDGSIYVLEQSFFSPRVHIFEPNGDARSAFPIYYSANSFAINSLGEIFIVEESSNRINVYNASGTLLRSKSGSGAGIGQLNGPYHIDIDANNHVYVYEKNNYRIQVFDKDFNYLRHFGSQGVGDDQFSNVQTIAVDNDKVYVYDHSSYQIKVYDHQGNFLLKFGSNGNAGGKFYSCTGIDTDPYGNIYTIDYSHNYIQIFSSEGTFLKQYRNPTNGQGVSNARAMALNANGDIHVISFLECRVQVYNHTYPTLTFDNITKDYGDGPFIPNASSSSLGAISFEEVNDVNEVVSLSGDEVTIHKGGSATLRAKLAASAPDLAYYKDAQLTVNKGAATLFSDNVSYEYDGLSKSVSVTTDPESLGDVLIEYYQAGELVSNPTDAGTYTAKINLISDYYEATEITRTLTITKAPLVFTTLDQTKVYKEPIPALTYTLEGFKNGEDTSVIDVLPTLTTSATINSNVGDYIIGLTGSGDLVDNNYFVSSTVNGHLTITKAPANINLSNLSKTYTGNSMFPDYDTEPVALGLFWQFAKNGISISGFPTEAGTYDLKAYISNANYEADTAMATFEITKAPLKIRANNGARAYGESIPSPLGNALHFDGVNDVVQIANNGQFSSMANEYTIEAWVNIENPNLNQKIFGSFAFSEGFLFGVVDGKVYFESTDANNEIKVLQAGTVEANIWTHLALTYKAGDKMVAYVDGTKVGEIDAPYSFKPSSTIIKIGEYLGYKFKGQVDELRVWNIAKNQSQISAERMAVPSVESSNLLAYYNFNSGDARYNNSAFTLLHDHSANSNHGTLTNFALDGESSNWIDNNIAGVDVTYLGFVGGDDESELSTLPFVYTNTTRFGNAGTYNLVPKGANAANYEITNQVGTLTVNKLPLALVSEDASRVYGDTNPEFTGTISGALAKDNLDIFLSTSALADSPAGNSFVIDVEAVDPQHKISNYDITKTRGYLTIEKAPLNLVIHDASRKYKAEDPSFTFELVGFKNGEDLSVINTLPTLSTNASADAAIGNYIIDAETELVDNNYDQASVEQGSLTIEKAPGTIEITDLQSTYNGSTQSASYAVEPFGDFQVEYEQNGMVLTDYPKDAGFYNVKAYYLDSNYEFDTARAVFEIAKASLTIKASSESKIYGSANPEFQYEISGFQNEEDVEVLDVLPTIHSESVNELSTVGEYAISLSGGSDNNYTYILESGLLNVTPRPVVVTADSFIKVYGDNLPEFTGSIENALASDNLSLEFTTEADRFSTIGSYAIEAVIQDPSNRLANYTVETNNGSITVEKREATIQIDDASRAYGEENPPFYGRVLNALPTDHLSLSFSTEAHIDSNVGTYGIEATITDPNDKIDNYEITSSTGTLTIEKAIPTLIFENIVKQLSASDFELEAISNSPANITYAVVSGDLEAINLVENRIEIVAVGSVVIRATQSESDNYVATQTEATLTITNLQIPDLTLANVTKTYGEAAFNLVADSDSEGALHYSLVEGTAISVSADGLVNIVRAGQAIVRVEQVATATHSAYSTTANITIVKAHLVAKVNDQNMVYGSELPEFTLSYSGFKNSDNQSNTDLFGTTNVTTNETDLTVGTYTTNLSGNIVAGNYEVAYEGGSLTVTPRHIKVLVDTLTKVYGDDLPTLSGNIVNVIATDELSIELSTEAYRNAPVAVYPINATILDPNNRLANYTTEIVKGSLIIDKRPVTVQIDNAIKVYGEENPYFTGRILGALPVDHLSLSLTTDALVDSNVGDYTISATIADPNGKIENYNPTLSTGILTIEKAVPALVLDDLVKSLSSADFELVANSNSPAGITYSVVSGDLEAINLTGSTVEVLGVGTVVIRATQAEADNYLATQTEASLTITDLQIPNLLLSNVSKTYGEEAFSLTASSDSEGTLSYSLLEGSAISVTAGGSVNILSAGSAKVKVEQASTATHAAYFAIANVTINKALLTVSASNQTMVYGSELPELTISYSGFKNADHQNLLSRKPEAITTASSSSDVGSYAISLTSGESNNYEFNLVEATLTITKANLQVLASSANRTYGSNNPVFEITYEGFKNGEDASVINTLPSTNTEANPNSPVGNYSISVCCGVDNNYDFTYQSGTLSVEKATLTVRAQNQIITYGESLPSLGFTYSGFKNNENEDVLTRTPVASTNATNESNAGDYAIEVSGAESNNYHFNYLSGTLTIEKATQRITFEPIGTKNVNDPDFEIHASSSSNLLVSYSLMSGPATLVGNTVSLTGEAGRVTIKASQAGNLNYLQAEDIEIGFDVNTKLNQTITFQAIANQFVGNEVAVEAVASSALAVTLEIIGGTAELNGNQLKLTRAGIVTLRATQLGNNEYNAAQPVEIQINVDYRTATTNLVVDQQSTCGDGTFTFTLTTEFAGSTPWVKWYQDEELLSEGLSKTFAINLTADELANVSAKVMPSEDAQANPSLEINTASIEIQAYLVTQATIQRVEYTLTANEGSAYQWFRNGQALTTTRSIIAEANGDYKVKVSYENGCESESEEINVVVLQLPDGFEAKPMVLYPNPANDYVKISIENETLQNVIVNLFDQQGRKVLTTHLKSSNDQIDVSTLRKGMYTLIVNGQSSRYTARFVKQ